MATLSVMRAARRAALCLVMWSAACDPAPAGGGDGALLGQDGAASRSPAPYATRLVSFQPGEGAGFGQDQLPGVVLGAPQGGGCCQGSLDVLSLGRGGVIVLALDDVGVVDGPGADLLVFENPFAGNEETGMVAVSQDGIAWHEWPCEPTAAPRYAGCAGVKPVLSAPGNGVSATDPAAAGGDAFDLADLGLSRARYVRIRDSGQNRNYAAPAGGFDLDAIAVVHGEPLMP